MPDELWNEVHDIVQETGIKTIPMEKKCNKAKWLSGEALQIAVKREMLKSFYRLDSRSICFILEDMPLTFPVFHVVTYTVLDTALKGLELINYGQF